MPVVASHGKLHIDFILGGEREVDDGENEGGLERTNVRVKGFIGVERG